MKSHPLILLAAVLICCGPADAQSGIPRALEYQPEARETSTVHDGIVFYRGQTYLIRHSRAALVDVTLVPKGQVLTAEGRLVALPSDFANATTPTLREGLFAIRGQAYLIRHGRMLRVNAALVPEGQVLTAEGQLVPLPLDFSGFVLDRAPDGSALLAPLVQAGPQVLSHQAGVTQAPKAIPAGTKPRFKPISLDLPRAAEIPEADLPRIAAAPAPRHLRKSAPHCHCQRASSRRRPQPRKARDRLDWKQASSFFDCLSASAHELISHQGITPPFSFCHEGHC